MSFQAYLDNIERQTGKTPQQLIDLAASQGFTSDSKASDIAAWLKTDIGLGHGHAMALVHVIKHGPALSNKHVGSDGSHADPTVTLRLDGLANR